MVKVQRLREGLKVVSTVKCRDGSKVEGSLKVDVTWKGGGGCLHIAHKHFCYEVREVNVKLCAVRGAEVTW